MTGDINGMRLINNTDIAETILVSTPGFDKRDQESTFVMKSNSIASSKTSTTEPLEDAGDGEEEEVCVNNLNSAIAVAAESIRQTPNDTFDAPQNESERRHTVSTSAPAKEFGFSTITVREYPRELGDNVTVSGPPISLSWKHQDEIVYDLLEYDDACRDTRRTQSELKMPSAHRDQILREVGYSRQDIQQAVKKSNIARIRRRRTVETLKLQPLQEAFERCIRVGKKPLRKKEPHLRMDKRITV